MNLLVRLLINSIAVFAAAYILPGVKLDNFITAVIVAIVLGVINTIIKPIVIFLTLPINIITLGLFTFVINAVIILLVDMLVKGFTVENFWWALLFSFVVSLISFFLRTLTK